MKWCIAVLKNYFGFRGRAGRLEFWMFSLASTIVFVALAIVDAYLGSTPAIEPAASVPSVDLPRARKQPITRWSAHVGTSRSAWWLLIGLIPVVGVIVLPCCCPALRPGLGGCTTPVAAGGGC